MDNRRFSGLDSNQANPSNVYLSDEEIRNAIDIVAAASISTNADATNTTNKGSGKFRLLDRDYDQELQNATCQAAGIGQKCVDDMTTTELIHLITNGVQSILINSTNEEFRRTNFARLKVRNTEDAAVVFRNQFLHLCGLKVDTSPEDIQLIQEEKENLPCETSFNSYTHLSLGNEENPIYPAQLRAMESQTLSESNNQAGFESPNIHLHNDCHQRSPSLLEIEGLPDDEYSDSAPFETGGDSPSLLDIVPTSYLENGNGNNRSPISPSLLENVESLVVEAEDSIPSLNCVLDYDTEAEDRRLNNWLNNKQYAQGSYYQQPSSSRLSNEEVGHSHLRKRQLTPEPTSAGPTKKLSKSEIQQALLSKLVFFKKKQDSQNISSGLSSTTNTQNSAFDYGD